MVKKLLLGVVAVVVFAVGGIVVGAQLRYDRQRGAPLPPIAASDDPDVIARGKYLVWGPGHCAGCHGALHRFDEYEESATEIPLTGGFTFEIVPASVVASNITPDKETGIGNMSDAEIARALRHGVARDGTMLFPIMPYKHVCDDDLTAIISYLRTLEPIKAQQEPTQWSMLGKIFTAYVMEPDGPTQPVPKSVSPAATVEYGTYLGDSLANCHGCHTNRDMVTGEFIGPKLGGGLELEHRGTVFVVPNITQGDGSRVDGWDESAFIARARTGKPSAPGSPMPWAALSKMCDDDLKALWKYLVSVDPVDNDTGPSVKQG